MANRWCRWRSTPGGVVGFVGFDRSRDPKSKPTTGEIWALYVQPSHWGRVSAWPCGTLRARALVEEGCNEVTLWVPVCNERALRFFELADFKRELNTSKIAMMGEIKVEEIRLRRGLD